MLKNIDVNVLRGKSKALVENYWDVCIPLDPIVFAKALNLKVVYKPIDVLRVSYLYPSQKTIVVNSNSNIIDRRFAIAREVGRSMLLQLNNIEDYDCKDIFNYDARIEKALDQFALELLMPAIAVKALIEIREIKNPAKLRSMFVVKSEMLHKRMKQLGYFL